MSAELNGFVELPAGGSQVMYLRVSSIDAVWAVRDGTHIQMRGYHESEEGCNTTLALKEVMLLISAAQNG